MSNCINDYERCTDEQQVLDAWRSDQRTLNAFLDEIANDTTYLDERSRHIDRATVELAIENLGRYGVALVARDEDGLYARDVCDDE